jgi:hypothetical protein
VNIEKPASPFGLLGDMDNLAKRIGRNLNIARSNVHNLKAAAQCGELHGIPQETLVRLLTETAEALDAVHS